MIEYLTSPQHLHIHRHGKSKLSIRIQKSFYIDALFTFYQARPAPKARPSDIGIRRKGSSRKALPSGSSIYAYYDTWRNIFTIRLLME
jgi:hypothetical protein